MGYPNPSFQAGGSIAPSVAVKIDTSLTTGFQVVVAGFNDRCVGIAQEGCRVAPIPDVTAYLAAQTGEELRVYGEGEVCLALYGATVTVGQWLYSLASATYSNVHYASMYDTLGSNNGVTITTGGALAPIQATIAGASTVVNVVARALEAGVSGELHQVQVMLFTSLPTST